MKKSFGCYVKNVSWGKNRKKQGENKAAVVAGGVSVVWMTVAVMDMETRGRIQDMSVVEQTIGLTDGD